MSRADDEAGVQPAAAGADGTDGRPAENERRESEDNAAGARRRRGSRGGRRRRKPAGEAAAAEQRPPETAPVETPRRAPRRMSPPRGGPGTCPWRR